MAGGQERRRHKRIAVTWTGEAQGDRQYATVEVINVSESGLGLVSLSPMQQGAIYSFKFAGWSEAPVEVVVRWSDIGQVQTYAGVEFVKLTEQQNAALTELIARFDKEDWGS